MFGTPFALRQTIPAIIVVPVLIRRIAALRGRWRWSEHLLRSQGRLFAGPQTDQHARNDRAVGLDLDALSRSAEQMPAAENLLEEAEEDFDRPAVVVHQRDHLGREGEPVGGDAKGAVANDGCETVRVLTRKDLKLEAACFTFAHWPPPEETHTRRITYHFLAPRGGTC